MAGTRQFFSSFLYREVFLRQSLSLLATLALLLGPLVQPAAAIRLKDIATFKGVRPNQLIGNGLVVGLNGTGDGTNVDFNIQELANMLSQLGINAVRDKMKVKNIAAVAVTALLPPFARAGSKIDVLVSSLGDSKSLQGGTLLLTPLKGVDGQVYALAQGAGVRGWVYCRWTSRRRGHQESSHCRAHRRRGYSGAGNSLRLPGKG